MTPSSSRHDERPPVALSDRVRASLQGCACLTRSSPRAQCPILVTAIGERRRSSSSRNAATPAATCFCTSMGTGPGVDEGFDLALSELSFSRWPRVTSCGSAPREEPRSLEEIGGSPAGPAELAARAALIEEAARQMSRKLDADTGTSTFSARNLEHPRWDDVAARCLACGNCTLVCPTCFCGAVEDTTTIDGTVERHRRWDSCFDLAHSLVHTGPVRASTRSRYRQWLTHKLSTWHDQFGSSGCVGCGRCITWCPVGIDLTAEVAAIAATDGFVPVRIESGGDR